MVVDFNRLGGGTPSAGRPVKGDTQAGGIRERAGEAPSTSANPSESGEGVSLSPVARQLQSVSGQLAQTSEVDTQRVADIRQALAENRYPIDAQRVAGKLLDFESRQ